MRHILLTSCSPISIPDLLTSNWTLSEMSRAPSNPFYSAPGPASPPPSAGPPSYNAATRPVPPRPSEPVSYTSLSDLTKGKQQQPPPTNQFSYEPSSQRAGYRDERFSSGGGGASAQQQQGTRRLPPDPTAHRDKSLLPPKRNVPGTIPTLPVALSTDSELIECLASTSPTPQAGPAGAAGTANQTYWQKAQGYVPNSVSATASTAGDRVKSGVDGVFTQQNRDAVSPPIALLPTSRSDLK